MYKPSLVSQNCLKLKISAFLAKCEVGNVYLESLYGERSRAHLGSHAVQFLVVITVLCLLAHFQLIQGGHPNIDMALLKQRSAVSKQEGEQQSPDVSTVDICICQKNHLQTYMV